MKKTLLPWGFLVVLPCIALAQSRESANAKIPVVTAGAEFSIFNPDFYCKSNSPVECDGGHLIKGIGIFGDYNLRGRWGVEGEARWLHFGGLDGQVESTYLVGPRIKLYRHRALSVWAKFLVGDGVITSAHYPGPNTFQGSLFVYAPGAAVDYRISRKLSLRADYEFQRWPKFGVGSLNGVNHNNGLTPNGFSFGVAYVFRP
jgi:opacity protein-like surface antigen